MKKWVRFVGGVAHLFRTVSVAMAGILAMAGTASAGFTTAEDTAATQTLSLQQLQAPGGGSFVFTEVSENFTPVLNTITITGSPVLAADQQNINLYDDTIGGVIGERLVVQNLVGAPGVVISYSAANDAGAIALQPVPGLTNTNLVGESFGPISVRFPTPIGIITDLTLSFLSDGNPTPAGGISDVLSVAVSTIPEPASAVMAVTAAAVGLLGYGWRRRRRATV